MERMIMVKIDVDPADPKRCGEDCDFGAETDGGDEVCTLHFQCIPDRFRCLQCLEAETAAKETPADRLLKSLKASGAAPGWYGPDGTSCYWEYQGGLVTIHWRRAELGVEEARLCGFVEVKANG